MEVAMNETTPKEKKKLLERVCDLSVHGWFSGDLGGGGRGCYPHFVFDQVAHRSQVPQIALVLQGEPVPNLPFEDDQRRRFCISNRNGLD
jgi:hypothetical protein